MSTINKIADGVIWTIASKFLSAAYAFVASAYTDWTLR